MTKRERAVRERLKAAQDECERTRAEAQWCHGYRTAGKDSPAMRQKEANWWGVYGNAERRRTLALAALLRVVRQEARNG